MRHFGDGFRLTLLTSDPALAGQADAAGVQRVGVDLERLGKAERQAGEDTRLSDHTFGDLVLLGRVLTQAALFVRVNPIHPNSAREIEQALACGARVMMLPYFRTADEVEQFVSFVRGRAMTIILVETSAAVLRIRDILAVNGIDEVMFGLNDLRLQFDVTSHFEVLASPLIGQLAAEVHRVGLPLSVGGVARTDDPVLPVSPDLVYAQYPRLGATGAWLSRSFFREVPSSWDFSEAIRLIRTRLSAWGAAPPEALEDARIKLIEQAGHISKGKSN